MLDQSMNKRLATTLIILAAVGFTACRKHVPAPEPFPGLDMPFENINTWIQLADAPELANSHKNGDLLSLHLINLSDKTIVLPNDFGARLLAQDGQEWLDVQNNFFTGSGLHYLPTRSSYPLGLIVDTSPYITGLSSSKNIRVIVVGHVERIDGAQVGAYIDVVIKP
jgi:hypothetical protein